MIKLKDLLSVCFSEMLVFDVTNEDTTYQETHMIVNHQDGKYDDYEIVDTTCCDDVIYVAIKKNQNIKSIGKLIDFCKDGFGMDISDNIWGWGNYFVVDNESNDYYNKVMNFFAMNIEVLKYDLSFFTVCDISRFILDNKIAFDIFMNEVNSDDFKPRNNEKLCKVDDYVMFEIYIATFQELINGNYSDDDYKKLYYELVTGGKENE